MPTPHPSTASPLPDHRLHPAVLAAHRRAELAAAAHADLRVEAVARLLRPVFPAASAIVADLYGWFAEDLTPTLIEIRNDAGTVLWCDDGSSTPSLPSGHPDRQWRQRRDTLEEHLAIALEFASPTLAGWQECDRDYDTPHYAIALPAARHDDRARDLDPDPPAVLAHRAELIAALQPASVPQDCLLLGRLIERAAAQPARPLVAADATIARLACAMRDPRVQNVALGLCLGQHAAGARRVWTLLTRTTPRPEVAHPAVLLAVSAYLDEDPSSADAALTIAVAADPDNPLARTVRLALDHSLRPHRFRRMLHASLEATARRPLTPRLVVDPEPF